jgi:hypothetical protein
MTASLEWVRQVLERRLAEATAPTREQRVSIFIQQVAALRQSWAMRNGWQFWQRGMCNLQTSRAPYGLESHHHRHLIAITVLS